MVLYNTIINKDLAAMTLIYFIVDIACQWAHLRAATYHRRGMVSPVPLLLTSGKRTRLTHGVAFTRAKTEVETVNSPARQTHFHLYMCCVSVHAVLQRVIKTCKAHYGLLHNGIQNLRYTMVRREKLTQRNRPGGKKDWKKIYKDDDILINLFFLLNFIYSSLP